MTEIQQWEAPASVAVRHTASMTRLVDWAQEADAAFTLAQRLTSTAFCPEQFRGKPAEGAAAMLAGVELGFSPMTALGAFDVIQGRAAAKAITLRALVQSKGHEIIMLESTSTRCRMKGRRANSTEWQTVAWTIDRAKDLGLTGKHNWRAQPAAMLIARATSEICRLVASDAILGIAGGYSSEEIADGGTPAQEVQEQVLDATQTGTRKMSRRTTQPEPAPEPADDVHDAEVVEDDAPDESRITKRQQGKLFALFNQKGIPEHEQAPGMAHILGREITSRTAITADEFDRVIAALESRPDAEAQS